MNTNQINTTRMKAAEYARTLWVVTTEQGVKREDLKRPEFWSLVSSQFRPYDRIEARCDDGTYFAEYLILACDRTWAKVHELSFVSLTSSDVSLSQASGPTFSVKWRGPKCLFSIVRDSDGGVIKEGFQQKEEAEAALIQYKRTIAT